MDAATAPPPLAAAVREARKHAASQGGVWQALLRELALPAAQVQRLLQEQYAIAVLPDLPVPAAAVAEGDPGLWVEVEGQPVLLCPDPWTPAALMAAALRPHAGLALALPHQVAPPASAAAAHPGPSVSAGATAAIHSPVVAFVDRAIGRAYDDGASDIHFETSRRGIGIKYRIDGVMCAGEQLDDPARGEEVISRIKVMAQLDITERRRPQDGRIHWEQAAREPLDLRVSVMPSIFGEDAVLRLLDRAQLRHTQQTVSLDALGFPAELAGRIRSLAARPHGMLLITGPTGSGKTTTVYAALTEVNDGLEKIITIEDPVEYELAGVLQIPVNEQKGLTFATGLRSILRHDPDKILVGEIRDAETAEIAVQSALTGHLVLTTVHANSLFDVLGRFQHFGIDPFGLASALNGVVVQRLLRRLCVRCVGWRAPLPADAMLYGTHGLPAPERLPLPVGCPHCRGSGYRARLVVAEVHELSDEHRDLIVRRAPLLEIKAALGGPGARPLLGAALAACQRGETTLEEIRRVVGLA